MHLFYTPDISENIYNFSESEAKHAVRVLRLKIGDTVQLIDGKGGFYHARIIDIDKKRCQVEVTDKEIGFGKPAVNVHLAVAPTKSTDRFETFLEKSVEIGLQKITPLLCDFSERKVIKPERLEKVIISAMKQSYKAHKTELADLTKFTDFIKNCTFEGQKFIAHCYDTPKKMLKTVFKPCGDVLILIGPEGDFSQNEVKFAVEHGFTEVSLSPARLRTETAAIVACHTVNLLSEN